MVCSKFHYVLHCRASPRCTTDLPTFVLLIGCVWEQVIDTRDAHDLAEVVEKDEGKLLEVVIKKFKEHVQDMCNA